MSFKKDFIWGCATASYQIEGAVREDGRKPSVWDDCAHRPGFVKTGATGDISCDHYHKWREDIENMAYMGLGGYRFSISWSRVIPDGTGAVNQPGLDFYDRLVDELLANNIEPFVTLFHWDYPTALYRRGGWLNPDSPKWFAEYTAILADRLSDRVSNWITLNEPQCFIDLGHREGRHAPGVSLPFDQVLACGHNALLAHGMAVQTLRAGCKKNPNIGFAPVGQVWMPHTDADVETARRKMFEVSDLSLFCDSWFSDPVFLGRYPEDGVRLFERFMPVIGSGDMKTINQDIDFYGVNIYRGTAITVENGVEKQIDDSLGSFTSFDWNVTPDALYWGPKFYYERYGKPVYITENGMAGTDFVNDEGRIIDDHRIVYTAQYLRELKRAAADGVDIRGYFHWTLLDNFEWAEGFTKRFGLVHVDYKSGKRTLKESAHWFKKTIETNGELL